jgi:hypothetical protein
MTATISTKTPIRVQMAVAAAIAMIGLTGAAPARASPGPVDLQVVDRDTGKVLRVWRHDGRLFVAGQPGARYALRVTNRTNGRMLVVMSVDGVNILTGETANPNQRGYIFSPHQSDDITGWRKSETEVAAFTFAPLPQSYAARTGRPADVGVIGIAAFKEKVEPLPPPPIVLERGGEDDAASAAAAPRAGRVRGVIAPSAPSPMEPPPPPPSVVVTGQRAAQPAPRAAGAYSAYDEASERRAEKLGTAHGAREYSVSYTEPFERATAYPQMVRQIEYDTYANLVASGVIDRDANPDRHPRPFPRTPGGGYVPDPPEQP